MTDPVMLLSQIHGEGRVTFRALRAAGFYTLESLAEASAHALSDRGHLSMQTARRLMAGAEEMLERGIGAVPPAPDTPSEVGPAEGDSMKGGIMHPQHNHRTPGKKPER